MVVTSERIAPYVFQAAISATFLAQRLELITPIIAVAWHAPTNQGLIQDDEMHESIAGVERGLRQLGARVLGLQIVIGADSNCRVAPMGETIGQFAGERPEDEH